MSLLASPLTILALLCMYPWTRWLLKSSDKNSYPKFPSEPPYQTLIAVTTLGLSVGMLSLIMLWLGLLGLRIDWRAATVICALIGGAGWIVLRFTSPPDPLSASREGEQRAIHFGFRIWIAILIGIMAGLIVFNAVYWPFGIDDAITIYAWFGKQIATSGQLPSGTLYELYPMLVPLSYAFTHQAAGWINEHLAALIPALLSVGVIGVAYLLGTYLYDQVTGLTAALLIALTPMYTHWASSGYVDLPASFFYGLVAVFLLRLDRTRSWQDAALAGIMAGLAAWTKNSGLLIVISITAWLVYRWWRDPSIRGPYSRYALLIAVAFLAVAGPWYARNLATTRMLIPPTGWTWKAEHTLANLFPYIADRRYFVTGFLFTAGLFLIGWQTWQARASRYLCAPVFLAIFFLPFFVIWWALFSYDGRFLLALTAFIGVMGARVVQEIARRIPANRQQIARIAAAMLALLLALPAASTAVDYKVELLHRPLMSDADQHRVRLGADRYDMALYLRTLPAGSRVWTGDLFVPYYADGIQMTVGGPPGPEQLASFDYWLLSPGDLLPGWFGPATPVHIEGGYRLYRVRHTQSF